MLAEITATFLTSVLAGVGWLLARVAKNEKQSEETQQRLMGGYSTREVSELIGLKPYQVRHYVRRHLLEPDRGERGEYRFTCPVCAMVVVKPAEHRTIDLLVASGVKMDTWTLPAELFESKSGIEITHDDILDFHRLLADEEATAEALAAISEL